TKCKVIVDAVVEGLHQILGTISLKSHDITKAEDTPMENHVFVVELDRSRISLVKSHYRIPTLTRNWRISRIAQRFVSGEGCGRWRNKVSYPMVNMIREPLPSDICAPPAIRSASTSRHLIEPLTGSVKIASSVALCLPRMTISTSN